MNELYSGEWTWKRFIKYLLPSMFTMLVMALYTIVDGLFLARYAGGNDLAALNIVFPFLNIVLGIILMISVGGGTIVSILLGEKKNREANEKFTLMIFLSFTISIVISTIGIIFMKDIIQLLGATEILIIPAGNYLKIQLLLLSLFMPKFVFDYLLRADGVPHIAFIVTIICGVLNIILDYIFIVLMDMGISGASLGTGIAGSIGTIFSVIYFLSSRSHLKFTKLRCDFKFLLNASINGSSEMINQWSASITTFLFNIITLKLLGESGIVSISVLVLMSFFLISTMLGTGMGFSPIISYFHGAKDTTSKNKITGMSLKIMIFLSLISFLISFFGGDSISLLFDSRGEGYGETLKDAFRFYSFSYLFAGFNLFASNYLTSINNGKMSAYIAIIRSFFGVVLGLLLLPKILGVNGIWLAVPFAELLAFIFSIIMILYLNRDKKQITAAITLKLIS